LEPCATVSVKMCFDIGLAIAVAIDSWKKKKKRKKLLQSLSGKGQGRGTLNYLQSNVFAFSPQIWNQSRICYYYSWNWK